MGAWDKVLKAVKEIKAEHDAYGNLQQELNPQPAYTGGGEFDGQGLDPDTFARLQSLGLSGVPAQPQVDASQDAAPAPDRSPASAPVAAAPVDLKSQLEDYLAKQTAGNDNLQKLADTQKEQMAAQGSKFNWSPILGLMDHFSGTNNLKSYVPPPTPLQQTQAQIKSQDDIQKNAQPITQDLLKQYGVDTNAATKAQAQYFKSLTDQQKRSTASDKTDTKYDTDSLKELNHDKEYLAASTKYFKGPGLLNTIDDATYVDNNNPGNPVARQSLATELGLYTSGGQRLHQTTVEAMGLNKGSLMQRLDQIQSDALHGTLSQSNADFAKAFIQKESKSANDEANAIKGLRATEFESIHGRLPKWAGVATSQGMIPQAPSTPTAPTSSGIPEGSKKMLTKSGEKIWLTPDNKRLPRQ